MVESEILQELLSLLEANGVVVRAEHLAGGGGGLCSMKDRRVFFLDKDVSDADSVAVAAKAIGQIVDIEGVYLRPQIRTIIEEQGI